MKILFFGDVVGKPGRDAVAAILPKLKKDLQPDLVIANAENLAHGKGVTLKTVNFLLGTGVDFLTSGNHIYDKPEAREVFEQLGDKLIRPANFSSSSKLSGDGYKILEVGGKKILLINLSGQVFMEQQFDHGEILNPFESLDQILLEHEDIKVKVLDFHAEATSEKRAMGLWADGRLSLMVGTHTHVASADAQILQNGTGYLSDLGMTGAAGTVIGIDKEAAMGRFLATSIKAKRGPLTIPENAKNFEVSFLLAEIDDETGKCKDINTKLILDYEFSNPDEK